jgi:hypothetical protein
MISTVISPSSSFIRLPCDGNIALDKVKILGLFPFTSNKVGASMDMLPNSLSKF